MALSPAPSAIVLFRKRPEADVRLFCLPYAGSGASVYRAWAAALPERIEAAAVQPPGRETRFAEPPLHRMDEFVAELIDAALPMMREKPFAFFGHSLGAIVALETTRALARGGLPQPRHVIVSARPAPHLLLRRERVAGLTRDGLIDWLRRVNGTPEAVLQSRELMDMYLPALRADLDVDDTYRSAADPPLHCPLTVLGGTADDEASPDELRAWSAYTTAECTLRLFDGGHFFAFGPLQSQVLAVVAAALE